MDDWMVAVVTISTISVFNSALVIATLLIFKRLRRQYLMQLVAFISVGDIIGNFPYLFPYRQKMGWLCTLQAIMNLTGYATAWLWTVALVYSLYRVATVGKLPDVRESRIMHGICWSLPITLALLQRTVCPYSSSSLKGIQVCTHGKTYEAMWYHSFTYYGLFFLCTLIMLVLLGLIYRAEWLQQNQVATSTFKVAKSALHWYPFLLVIFWLPHSVSSLDEDERHVSTNLYNLGLMWRIVHGMVTAWVFFYKSSEARRLWWQLTLARFFPSNSVDLHPQSESIIDRDSAIRQSSIGLSFTEFAQSQNIHNAIHESDSIIELEGV